MFPYKLLAPDLADDRNREIERSLRLRRLVALASHDRSAQRSFIRRPAARVAAFVSLTAAAAVRRLDECVAEDLENSLIPTE